MARQIRMEDGDVIYITVSLVAELQRFAGTISQTILPVVATTTVIDQ